MRQQNRCIIVLVVLWVTTMIIYLIPRPYVLEQISRFFFWQWKRMGKVSAILFYWFETLSRQS